MNRRKEHKFVIVRTYKNHIADCYAFMTREYNCGTIAPTLVSACRVCEEINIKPYVGGMLSIELTSQHTNGTNLYPVIETVYFDKGIVSGIEIYTEFSECRNQVARANELEKGTSGK